MKILFLSRSLAPGGAERQLVSLAKGLHARGHAVYVAIFYGGYPWEDELRQAGVDVHCLGKSGRWDTLRFLARLARLVRRLKPDIVHGYMPVPDIVAALLKPLAGGSRLVWGVRCSDMPLGRYDRLSRLAYGLERRLSRLPDLVIANSRSGMTRAVENGFPPDTMLRISNGIDTDRFAPDPEAGDRRRAEWGIGAGETIIGLVARLDPMKDHGTFLRAAALLRAGTAQVRFVCAGSGPAAYVQALQRQATELGVADRILWVGSTTSEMAPLYNAMDICTLSSYAGEGFPNAVGEAMACTVPCVVTDVGDAAEIVGDTGVVVPARDPEALARGWQTMLARRGPEAGRRARARIVAHYSERAMVERSEEALLKLLRAR